MLIGGTALELGDRFSIPNGRIVSGALVQALAAETILQDRLLRSTSLIARFTGPAIMVLCDDFAVALFGVHASDCPYWVGNCGRDWRDAPAGKLRDQVRHVNSSTSSLSRTSPLSLSMKSISEIYSNLSLNGGSSASQCRSVTA